MTVYYLQSFLYEKLKMLYEGYKQNSPPPHNLMLAITRATTTPTIEILLENQKAQSLY